MAETATPFDGCHPTLLLPMIALDPDILLCYDYRRTRSGGRRCRTLRPIDRGTPQGSRCIRSGLRSAHGFLASHARDVEPQIVRLCDEHRRSAPSLLVRRILPGSRIAGPRAEHDGVVRRVRTLGAKDADPRGGFAPRVTGKVDGGRLRSHAFRRPDAARAVRC